jgi:hypothetical protein
MERNRCEAMNSGGGRCHRGSTDGRECRQHRRISAISQTNTRKGTGAARHLPDKALRPDEDTNRELYGRVITNSNPA